MSNRTDPPDIELVAIAACLAALRPLSEAARNRALAYLTERLATEAAAQNGNGNGGGGTP
jgi:hypothetical protein